ncbi:cathepsin L-like proteinase isoform X2 [Erythrolamprus reginae]|uniref:cathepsin L-like proteinase isoform X2 n=1 Tax=Erythrolamprus reginae TaxID=121349 RepID=UPI00396CCC07
MLSSWVMLITWLVSLKEFSIAQDSASDDAWTDWKRIYGRVYTDQEEASRRATWENTLQIVEQHNREADEGKHTYWMKMNHFSDWTNEELSHMLLLPERADPDNASQGFVQGPEIQPTPKPKKCHHRSHGTSRKDQKKTKQTSFWKIGKVLSKVQQRNQESLRKEVWVYKPLSSPLPEMLQAGLVDKTRL